MNTDSEKPDELQKMLALKRHEAPPPRYFKGFSAKVIDRLHAPESPQTRTWWTRLRLDIEARPLEVSACGVVVCGLPAAGMLVSLRVEPPKTLPGGNDDRLVGNPPGQQPVPGSLVPAVAPEKTPRIGEPVVASDPSLFSTGKVQVIR